MGFNFEGGGGEGMFFFVFCFFNGIFIEVIRRYMVKILNFNILRNIVRSYICKSVIVIKFGFYNDMVCYIVKE